MSNATSYTEQGNNAFATSALLPLLQEISGNRIAIDPASSRCNSDQNSGQSIGSVQQQDNVHLNQQSRQMNGNGNDALSLALVGGLAKVVGLADLQALLGNKNNSSSNINSGQDGQNLDISLSQTIEQQRQASSLLPMQQQQNNTVSPSGTILGQSASIVSQAPPSSHVGTPGDNMSRFSYSTQRLEGSSATTSSGVRGNKTKRIVVVPCRARGMSIEHNFQTAYFEIPDNIKHGDGLICSFPECRNRGVKFLYCAYCKDPVAKRNFRNRHTHDKEAAKEQDNKRSPPPEHSKRTPLSTAVKRLDSTSTKSPHEVSEGTGVSSTGSSSNSGVLPVPSKHHNRKDARRHAGNINNDTSKTKLARMDEERKEAWTCLLAERPSIGHTDAMSAWLMKVMAVSDPKKPTDQAIAEVKATIPSSDSPAELSTGQGTSGSSNEDPNESSPTHESSPMDESSPTESTSDDAGKDMHKNMNASKPASSNDASNEDSLPTNGSSNESSSNSTSDSRDDMDMKEIWIRD